MSESSKPTFPKSYSDLFGSVSDFLKERGWEWNCWVKPDYLGWADYKTNNRYRDWTIPLLIESIRLDTELNLKDNDLYIEDKDKHEVFLNFIETLNK